MYQIVSFKDVEFEDGPNKVAELDSAKEVMMWLFLNLPSSEWEDHNVVAWDSDNPVWFEVDNFILAYKKTEEEKK